MEGAMERYLSLHVRQSLSQADGYTSGCKLLELLLKNSYYKFTKSFQSLIFEDVLTAFRHLPRMQTESALEAAIKLRQGVMTALPKRKKVMAVTEFKHAIIAHKRHCKPREIEEDLDELPEDVVSHIFTFMDLPSLVSASQVCRSWNIASNDSHLCHSIYTNTLHISSKIRSNHSHGGLTQEELFQESSSINWKSIFKQAYNDYSWKEVLTSSCRGLCKRCHAIIWVADLGKKTKIS